MYILFEFEVVVELDWIEEIDEKLKGVIEVNR